MQVTVPDQLDIPQADVVHTHWNENKTTLWNDADPAA
jgi:hypothetical protein